MKMPGVARAKRAVRAAGHLLAPHGVILMYHRVAQAEHDPWSLCVSPKHFSEQLEILHRRADVVPLQHLFETIEEGRRARPAVAITFDDGYADNLHSAKPILERHSAPATVFVASGYTDTSRAFWSDELVQIVLGTQLLPDHLILTIGDTPFEWTRTATEPAAERKTLLLDLWQRMRPLTFNEQMDLLDELKQWANCHETSDPLARPLSSAEITQLAADGLIEIGAHTVSHCELPAQTPAKQMNEVAGSKAACEAMAERPVKSFAYPYGRFDEKSVDCVRRSGFAFACTTRPGLNLARTDRYRLPRLAIRDWNGDEFERRFRRRFDPEACVA